MAVESTEKLKGIIYIAVGLCTLITIATSVAVQFNSISDHERRLMNVESNQQEQALADMSYKKDIEQITKDITELKATNAKILETLLGR